MRLTDTKRKRLAIIIGVVVLWLAVGVVYTWVADREVRQAQDELLETLRSEYAGTTVEDAYRGSVDFGNPKFFAVAGRPDQFGDPPGKGGFRARWVVERWGKRRCVVVTWLRTGEPSFSGGRDACDLIDK